MTTTAVLLLAACGPGGQTPDVGRCPALATVATDGHGVRGSFEEASLVALGELFRAYPDGRPMPVEVTGDIVEVAGAPVWHLEGAYQVTVGGQVRTDRWVLWVGSDGAGLEVVCAIGPAGVGWPPAGSAGTPPTGTRLEDMINRM